MPEKLIENPINSTIVPFTKQPNTNSSDLLNIQGSFEQNLQICSFSSWWAFSDPNPLSEQDEVSNEFNLPNYQNDQIGGEYTELCNGVL